MRQPARAASQHGPQPSITVSTPLPRGTLYAFIALHRPHPRRRRRPQRGVRDISDAFFRRTVRQLELAFEGGFHYAPFYAYAKLKEQEVKNLVWIATCLEHGVHSELDRIIPVFPRNPAPGAGGGTGGRK
jgi:hypothetical protein